MSADKCCRCNSSYQDPDCHIDHTLNQALLREAFPAASPPDQHQKAYKALDELIKAVGQLPTHEVLTRPPLYRAVNDGLKELDRAVKEHRYVVPSRE